MEQRAQKPKVMLAAIGFAVGFLPFFGLGFWIYGLEFLTNGEGLGPACFIGTIVGFFIACFLSGAGKQQGKRFDSDDPDDITWDKSYSSRSDWLVNGFEPKIHSD